MIKIYSIGRENVDIMVEGTNQGVSRKHAELTVARDGRLYLVDCNSSFGTFVCINGTWERIRQEWVEPDQEIRLGRKQLRVRDLLAGIPCPTGSIPEPVSRDQPGAVNV